MNRVEYGFNNSIIQSSINLLINKIQEKRDNHIISILNSLGYFFDSKEELEHFAKTRCELMTFKTNDTKILMVDGIEVCQWNNKLDIIHENGKITVTMDEIIIR